MKPSVGRIVHYVLKNGQHRPAIVVRNWADEGVYVKEMGVNLYVFTDGVNDRPEYGTAWAPSVMFSDAKEEGTWHWPEREG